MISFMWNPGKAKLIYSSRKINSSLLTDKRWEITTKGHIGTFVGWWKLYLNYGDRLLEYMHLLKFNELYI